MKQILILFLALVLVVGIPRIIDSNTDRYAVRPDLEYSEPQGGGLEDNEVQLSVKEIKDNPSPYIDEIIVFQGMIKQKLTDRVYIFEHKRGDIDSDIMIISNNSISLEKGKYVQIKGKIQRFYYVELNKFENIELDPDIHSEYEGKPLVTADEVKELPANPNSVFYYAPLKPFF